jgi:hypothetical protein
MSDLKPSEPCRARQQKVAKMNYFLPSNPSSPVSSLKSIRERARRDGYLVAADRTTGTFTLVDARLRLPLLGLNGVGLSDIAHAIEHLRRIQPVHQAAKELGRECENSWR